MESFEAQTCPQCDGALEQTQGQALVVCPFCNAELKRQLTAIESTERVLQRREEVMPTVERLMARYTSHFIAGDKQGALRMMEAVQYLTLSMTYEVDELSELDAMATPFVKDTAKQLGVEYVPPHKREEAVTHAYVDKLLETKVSFLQEA